MPSLRQSRWYSIAMAAPTHQRAAINAARSEGWKQTAKSPGRSVVGSGAGRCALRCPERRGPGARLVHIGAKIEVGVALPPRSKREWKLFNRCRTRGRKLLEEFTKCEHDADALSVFFDGLLVRLPSLTAASGRLSRSKYGERPTVWPRRSRMSRYRAIRICAVAATVTQSSSKKPCRLGLSPRPQLCS